jgi:dihydrofolate reductase
MQDVHQEEKTMANFIYIACSIDGFIAKKDGNIDWLIDIPNEKNVDYGISEFMNKIDGIIMGRKTFEKILEMNLSVWPYNKPVFVLSSRLKGISNNLNGKVEIVNGNIEDILAKLKAKNINNLYINGEKAVQSFLEKDLIDEMIISTISIILGEGIPLFGKTNKEIKFVLEKTEYINEYVAKNYYKKRIWPILI